MRPQPPSSANEERYEPLPGLLRLPGHLYRRLSPRGRRRVRVGGLLFLVAAAITTAIMVPRIVETKEERAERERQQAAAALAERKREQTAIQRPSFGRATPAPGGTEPPAQVRSARRAFVDTGGAAIVAHALDLVEAGEIQGPILGSQCEPYPRSAATPDPRVRLDLDRGLYQCLAKRVERPRSEFNVSLVFGYPYRLRADFESGRYAFCRLALEAGEGSYRGRALVPLPDACRE